MGHIWVLGCTLFSYMFYLWLFCRVSDRVPHDMHAAALVVLDCGPTVLPHICVHPVPLHPLNCGPQGGLGLVLGF